MGGVSPARGGTSKKNCPVVQYCTVQYRIHWIVPFFILVKMLPLSTTSFFLLMEPPPKFPSTKLEPPILVPSWNWHPPTLSKLELVPPLHSSIYLLLTIQCTAPFKVHCVYTAVHCCAVQYCTGLQYSTLQYSTVLFCTVWYCTKKVYSPVKS